MHVEGGVAESVMEGSTDPGIARLGTNDSDKAAEFLCCGILMLVCTLSPVCERACFLVEVHVLFNANPQWDTADAEIKDPPGGSPGLSKVSFFLSLSF